MRVLIDYRPALRERSGAGEYTHQLAAALRAIDRASDDAHAIDITLFSSSWRDRLVLGPDLAGTRAIDRRVPVALLNLAWHRGGWPPVELLTGRAFDVAHSSHPLVMPAKDAAPVVTIHDLDFLAHPERTRREIRRDYAALVAAHAHRAAGILVPSQFTAHEVTARLSVDPARIACCPPGAPDWPARTALPDNGYLLFFSTLEPRKNIGGLLDAYERLLANESATRSTAGTARSTSCRVPDLVLAGRATEDARSWLDRISRPPLAGRVRHIGYIRPEDRHALYAGARLLVQPSFDEGFGMPVLEAMTVGVPVVVSNRGALPEVVGDAGPHVDPDDPAAMAAAIAALLADEGRASAAAARGIVRARAFSWPATAAKVIDAYERAVNVHRARTGRGR